VGSGTAKQGSFRRAAAGGGPGRVPFDYGTVHLTHTLGPDAATRGPPSPRAPLLLLLLLPACTLMGPALGGMRGTATAPVPEVVKRYPWMADVRWPGAAARPTPEEELKIAEDIEALLNGDFDVYPLAGRRLIARGQEVLPYLGHAVARNPAPTARKERLEIVFEPVLRDTTEARVLLALTSPYPAVRAAAAKAVGEREIVTLGPRLADLLDDPDLEVRQASIASLRRLTGEFLEYRADAAPAVRAAGAARWQDYWQRR
jgi:hypothetical protein